MTKRPYTHAPDPDEVAAIAQFEAALSAAQSAGIILDFAYNTDLQAQWRRWMQSETVRLGHLLAIAVLPSGAAGHVWLSEGMLGHTDRIAFTARALHLIVTARRQQCEADLYDPSTPTLCKFIITEQSGDLYTSQKIDALAPLPAPPLVRDFRTAQMGWLVRLYWRLRSRLRGELRRAPTLPPPPQQFVA